jgi:hypothetical protein
MRSSLPALLVLVLLLAHCDAVRLSKFRQILNTCTTCIETSGFKFSSGQSQASNAKPQMGTWIEEDLMALLVEDLEDTFIEDSGMGRTLLQASVPTVANVASSDDFDLSVISLPPGTLLAPRTHAAGTVLLYRALYGEGSIATTVGSRVISDNLLSAANETARVLRRVGGPSRVLAAPNVSCAMLELALHPPTYCASLFEGGGIGVKLDVEEGMDKNTLVLTVPEV